MSPDGVRPLDTDGITAITVGTAAWAVLLVACLALRGWLEESGRGWWAGVCAAGVAGGLIGLVLALRRRARIRHRMRPQA